MTMETIDREMEPTHSSIQRRMSDPRSLLESVALALNSTLELPEVLRILAELVLRASEADRCSIFLIEGDRLIPTASTGLESDEELWRAFRNMDDIRIDEIPEAREFFSRGAPVGVIDAGSSPLIPRRWTERFCLGSLVVVPLIAAGAPSGVMAVDYRRRRLFTPEDLALQKAIGSYAAVAIRNARLFAETSMRAKLNSSLALAATHLISQLPMDRLADELLDAVVGICSAEYCAIGILNADHDAVDAIASKGIAPLATPVPIADIPAEIVETLRSTWRDDEPIDLGWNPLISRFLGLERIETAHYLLPIKAEDHLTGGILLGGTRFRLKDAERAALQALSSIASAALERIWLVKRLGDQIRQMGILHDLGEILAGRIDADGIVRQVNNLLKDERIEVRSMSFRRRSTVHHLGGREPGRIDRMVWRSGRAMSDGDALCVPMRLSGMTIGTITVRPREFTCEGLSFLSSLSDGLAQLVSRATMRAEAEESARESAIAAERGRIAAELHQTVEQGFIAIGMLARQILREGDSGAAIQEACLRIVELAESGKWDIDQAVRWLAVFPEARGGIVPALEALKGSFETDRGIPIVFDRSGRIAHLNARIERALYRVACGALSNACRFGSSTAIRMRLIFEDDSVILTVADDGTGASTRQLDHRVRRAVSDMRAAVSEVGGVLRISSARPRGVIASASIPRKLS